MSELYNVDDLGSELIDCVMECYRDDIDKEETKELVSSILRYLYSITKDSKIKSQIADIVENQLEYCITCGNKLAYYEWEEVHTEVPPPNVEYMSTIYCPCCDS